MALVYVRLIIHAPVRLLFVNPVGICHGTRAWSWAHTRMHTHTKTDIHARTLFCLNHLMLATFMLCSLSLSLPRSLSLALARTRLLLLSDALIALCDVI